MGGHAVTVEFIARPWLGLLLVVPIAARLLAQVRRELPREPFATPAALASLVVGTRRRWGSPLRVVGWLLLIVGAAGPRWGEGEPDGVARGRDVVVLIDLSGSMLAADTDGPTRWQSAIAAARTLAEWLRHDPGNRVALIAFAAHPKLIVPLTADADHLETSLNELDGDAPPRAILAGPADRSGTRFGEAITVGASLGGQSLILLSDGDDPANDREWANGVTAARAAGVPVHVVGIGGAVESPIVRRGELVEHVLNGVRTPVLSRQNAELLRELAAESRGDYRDASQTTPDLTALMPDGDERELTSGATPTRRDRAAWFLLAGIMCWLVGRR